MIQRFASETFLDRVLLCTQTDPGTSILVAHRDHIQSAMAAFVWSALCHQKETTGKMQCVRLWLHTLRSEICKPTHAGPPSVEETLARVGREPMAPLVDNGTAGGACIRGVDPYAHVPHRLLTRTESCCWLFRQQYWIGDVCTLLARFSSETGEDPF